MKSVITTSNFVEKNSNFYIFFSAAQFKLKKHFLMLENETFKSLVLC